MIKKEEKIICFIYIINNIDETGMIKGPDKNICPC